MLVLARGFHTGRAGGAQLICFRAGHRHGSGSDGPEGLVQVRVADMNLYSVEEQTMHERTRWHVMSAHELPQGRLNSTEVLEMYCVLLESSEGSAGSD